jgi:hypothetical protein
VALLLFIYEKNVWARRELAGRGGTCATPLVASMAIHIRIDPFFGTRIECRNRGDFG